MASDKGNIVNLSDFRQKAKKSGKKAKSPVSRQEKERIAAANRARTGRTGAEKKHAKAQKEKERRLFEGKKLDPAAKPGQRDGANEGGKPDESGTADAED